MVTDRQILETVARCVATVVFFQNSPQTRHSSLLMAAELRTISAGAAELGLKPSQVQERILNPVEGELIARYGAETAHALYKNFHKAFGGAAGPAPFLSPFKV